VVVEFSRRRGGSESVHPVLGGGASFCGGILQGGAGRGRGRHTGGRQGAALQGLRLGVEERGTQGQVWAHGKQGIGCAGARVPGGWALGLEAQAQGHAAAVAHGGKVAGSRDGAGRARARGGNALSHSKDRAAGGTQGRAMAAGGARARGLHGVASRRCRRGARRLHSIAWGR
jgi:hypothetical protein